MTYYSVYGLVYTFIMFSSVCSNMSKFCNMLLCKHDQHSVVEKPIRNELIDDEVLADKTKYIIFFLDGNT